MGVPNLESCCHRDPFTARAKRGSSVSGWTRLHKKSLRYAVDAEAQIGFLLKKDPTQMYTCLEIGLYDQIQALRRIGMTSVLVATSACVAAFVIDLLKIYVVQPIFGKHDYQSHLLGVFNVDARVFLGFVCGAMMAVLGLAFSQTFLAMRKFIQTNIPPPAYR